MLTRSYPTRILLLLAALPLAFATGCSEADVNDARASVVSTDADNRGPRRRVWAEAGDYSTVSPDGRLVTWVDWTTGDVAVYDLETARARLVTDKGAWSENGSWAEEPTFSQDGSRIAFGYGNTLVTEMPDFLYELRIVDTDGSNERVLFQFEPEDDGWLSPEVWSEDHGILTEFWYGPREGWVGLVDVESGDVTRVTEIGRNGLDSAVLSPDGRRVAFLQDGELRLLDLASRQVAGTGIQGESLYGWTPEGDALLIRGGDSGAGQVARLPVRDGRVVGDAEGLEDGLLYTSGAGQAGDRYFYRLPVDGPRVYATAVDPAANRLLAEPTPVSPVSNGRVMDAAWSPDGRQHAWVVQGPNNRTSTVMLRSAEGDDLVALAELGPSQRVVGLDWTEDGSALYLNHVSPSEGYRLLRIDARTGSVSTVFAAPERYGGAVLGHVVPDESGVVFSRFDERHPDDGLLGELVYYDFGTGQERLLMRLREMARSFSVSPDGSTVALVTRRDQSDPDASPALLLQPLDGGEPRVLFTGSMVETLVSPNAGRLPWSADGTRVLMVESRPLNGPDGEYERWLSAVSVADGARQRLPVPLEMQTSAGNSNVRPDWHPDGRRISLVMGLPRSELWMMEGLN